MNEIPFLPEAEEEFLEWIGRYEGEVRGLGGEFIRPAPTRLLAGPHVTCARRPAHLILGVRCVSARDIQEAD